MQHSGNPFAETLKAWRARRRLSQLDLSLAANVSARHIAFLETGRSRPSRLMAMQLGEALDMPRGERNRLLEAAGFRAAWSSRTLEDAELQPVRRAISRMIERHDPWPAMVIDRHWNLVEANRAGQAVFAVLGVGPGQSVLEAFLAPERGPSLIANWPEVGHHMLQRLRTESAHLGGDAVLDSAVARLAADPSLGKPPAPDTMPALIPIRYMLGGQVFSVFSTIAQFGTAEDIALADLRIELLFPADEETEAAFEAMA